MRTVLIIDLNQFGYDTYYNYVKYLGKKYKVDYWCLDKKQPKIKYSGRNLLYFKRPVNKISYINLIVSMTRLMRKSDYDYILYRNYKFAFFIKFFSRKKSMFDIRTVSVSENIIERITYNASIKFNCLFFERIFSISQEILNVFKIPKNKSNVIPLGAEITVNRSEKQLTTMKFLYVGTLDSRNIHATVKGLSYFCIRNPTVIISYTIVGSGKRNEVEKVQDAVTKSPHNLKVTLKGYIPNHKLSQYYEESNIGVSYVPLKPWYFPQPVTKTYEYLLAGMVVIATALPSNIEAINENNGVIISDNPESFAKGVTWIYENLSQYKLDEIAESSRKYHWQGVVEQHLIKNLLHS